MLTATGIFYDMLCCMQLLSLPGQTQLGHSIMYVQMLTFCDFDVFCVLVSFFKFCGHMKVVKFYELVQLAKKAKITPLRNFVLIWCDAI